MKKAIGLLFWAFGVAGVLAEDTNDAAIYKLLGEKGQEIRAHIAAYDKTTNFQDIGSAWWKLVMLHATNGAMADAELLVEVELLSRCLAGVDKTFDERQRQQFTRGTWVIRNSERPSDPEARKQYDQWVAEDEQFRQRVLRNQGLKKWGEACRRHLQASLEGSVARGEFEAVAAITNAIARKIKDAPTRDQLLKGVEEQSRKRAEGQGWGPTPGPPKQAELPLFRAPSGEAGPQSGRGMR
jgi:hypothetical protein